MTLEDLHKHNEMCHHAVGSIEDYLKQAIKSRLQTLGVSDHFPYEFLTNIERIPYEEYAITLPEIEDYLSTAEKLKEKYPKIIKNLFIKLNIDINARAENLSLDDFLILFEKLELPIISKTPKGQPSTAESVLVELAHDYELPKLLLEHRSLAKLKSTYTDKLPKMIDSNTGRIHTSYQQAVAATGRLSSTEPNLQNIPVRSEEGRRIRKAFIANPGNKILAADYSQIELRIMAHLSEDTGLVTAFENGVDVHSATAAEVFSVDVDAVTKEQRRRAKAINFGLIYGMSAFGLSKQLNIPRNEAQKYMDLYFERYPGVLEYMDSTRESAKEKGYVETVFGRRLYLPDIKASNGARRKGAERAAINAPMQGTAADIIKMAMIKVDDWIRKNASDDVTMMMPVHDELVFAIKAAKVETFKSAKALAQFRFAPDQVYNILVFIEGKKDGSSFPALKTVKSIVLNDEEVLLEGFVDMSEVVKAEEELRLNEQKFKEILIENNVTL